MCPGILTLGGTAANPFVISATGTYADLDSTTSSTTTASLSGNGFFTFSGPLGFNFTLDFNTPGKVFLNVSNDPNVLAWNGIANTNWDFVTPELHAGHRRQLSPTAIPRP